MGVLTGSLLAAPRAVEAQQDRMYRVGVIHQGGGSYDQALKGLRDGIKELGLEECKHFVLHVRDTRGDLKAAEEAASNLEAEKVDMIVTFSTSCTIWASPTRRPSSPRRRPFSAISTRRSPRSTAAANRPEPLTRQAGESHRGGHTERRPGRRPEGRQLVRLLRSPHRRRAPSSRARSLSARERVGK